MTRAMFAMILARYDGAELDNSVSGFVDVEAGQWYTGAVGWADAVGIMNGKGDGIFDPEAPITREEMMTVLAGYAEYKGVGLESISAVIFDDDGEISAWAKEPVMTMKSNGVVVGKGGNCFAPKDDTTRAEAAQILVNYIDLIEG